MKVRAHANHLKLSIVLAEMDKQCKDYTLCDKELKFQIRGGGFQISHVNGREQYYADLRYNEGTNNLVCEFVVNSQTDTLELPLIKVVDAEQSEEMAHAIVRWFAITDGRVFQVAANGSIPAYTVMRYKGKTHISPRTEA